MGKSILITDSLYMSDDHVQRLQSYGFAVDRLDEVEATEGQLIEALKGKNGYVLGGIEKVTGAVVSAASELEGIAFCGAGWSECIVAHQELTSKGIPITSTAGSNAASVAEFTLSVMFASLRQVATICSETLGVDSADSKKFLIPAPREWSELRACVIGAGHIGSRLFSQLAGLGFRVSLVDRKTTDKQRENYLREADIVAVCVDKVHGTNVIGREELSTLKDGCLVVNTVFPEAVDSTALKSELERGRLFAAFDAVSPDLNARHFSMGRLIGSNAQAAYNTVEAIKRTSDWATASIANILLTGTDERIVNL